jgi:hypothetical protein
LQLLCGGDSFLLSDIAYIDTLLQETVVWMKMLWDLKQFLLGSYGVNPSVVKLHVYTHSPPFILSHGAPKNTNTEVLEHAHREGVHLPSLRISNRGEEALTDLMKFSLMRRRVKLLNYALHEKKKDPRIGADSTTSTESLAERQRAKDMTGSGAPRTGFLELTWLPRNRGVPTQAYFESSSRVAAASPGDSWVIDPNCLSSLTDLNELPLHPVLLSQLSQLSMRFRSNDRIPHLTILDPYLETFLSNVNDNQETRTFYSCLFDEARKERRIARYRLYLVPFCKLRLGPQNTFLDDDEGDLDDEEQQDDSRSVISSVFCGSDAGEYDTGNSSAKQKMSFVLHSTNTAKTGRFSNSPRRSQFDFVDVKWNTGERSVQVGLEEDCQCQHNF